jgi:hypothetical protein
MNGIKIKVLAIAASAVIFSAGLFAAAPQSVQFAGESMAIGVGARPLGMGATFAGIADDASTSYWNPAGMTNINGVEVSSVKLTRINDLDTNYSYVNLVYNTGVAGAIGIGWLRQSIGGITITDSSGTIVPGKDNMSNADNVIYLAYAYPITKGFSIGLGGKLMLGNYPNQYSTVNYMGGGLDVGFFFKAGEFVKELKGLQLGLNLQDVITEIKWDPISGVTTTAGTTEKVDMNAKPGIAYKIDFGQFEITPAIDLDTKYQLIIHGGMELWWNKMIAIRGGIKSWGGISNGTAGGTLTQRMDWSMGASIRWYFIGIDYAYVDSELTPVQYLSIVGKF